MEREVIIVAGGSDKRMAGNIPKQFIEVNGKPILMHTMACFHDFDSRIKQILVLPTNQIEYWKTLCTTHHFTIEHKIAEGGDERFFSVQNGLKISNPKALIAIHDAVRPCVDKNVIHACYLAAELYAAAIPTLPLNDSIRELTDNGNKMADRSRFCIVQTPQVFQGELLHRAYTQPYSTHFTDDASVVEATGVSIKLVQGNRENIKITTPIELKLAALLLP